jgi:hypothetical protein
VRSFDFWCSAATKRHLPSGPAFLESAWENSYLEYVFSRHGYSELYSALNGQALLQTTVTHKLPKVTSV